MKLNEIRDQKGATTERIRVARGIGSGKGRTGGRGTKGQKSRSGVSINGYEGGQMPFYRRVPKRGFANISRMDYAEINLGRIQKAIDENLIDATKEINEVVIMETGMLKKVKDGLRLLGNGEIKTAVTICVAGATKSAVEAVEKVGGKVLIKQKNVKEEK